MKKNNKVLEILGIQGADTANRICDALECNKSGKFRAPKSRDDLKNYYWFCKDHVRHYNSHWNFYAGMSSPEIEKQIRADTTWERPTWPLGSQGLKKFNTVSDTISQSFQIFGENNWDKLNNRSKFSNKGHYPHPGSLNMEALAVLNLNPPVTKSIIKNQYKILVKRYHPDTNGGDKKAEEKLKLINRAYSALIANETF